jgi:hypothetical protein
VGVYNIEDFQRSANRGETMPDLPPLKTDPKYGYFPWWPEEGEAWIHPDDVATARAMIPSGRIFRRDGRSGSFMLLRYGDATLRIRPTLWQEVEPEGFEIGDWVEVRTRGLANEPRTGIIAEIAWDDHAGEIRYQLVENGQPIEARYACDDLKHVDPTPPTGKHP